MLRKSARLQKVGYYTKEGRPTVSYREILYRVNRRRKGHGGGQHHMDSADHLESMNHHHESIANRLSSQSINTTDRTQIIPCFLLLLLLGVGFTQYTHTCIQLKEVQQEVQMLNQWTDTLGPLADTMENFALESLGARVLRHLSSDTYCSKGAGAWDRLFFGSYSSKAQRRVIQGQSPLLPGQCWPFAGSHGHLFVSLSHPVSITHVTLGHIPKSQSPDGNISRAPRQFSIYGMNSTDEEGTNLGTLVYGQDSAAFQTFKLPNPDMGVFRYVKLQISSNWGHMEKTCLYSFRVHSNSKMI